MLNDGWQGSSKITLQLFWGFLSLAYTSYGCKQFCQEIIVSSLFVIYRNHMIVCTDINRKTCQKINISFENELIYIIYTTKTKLLTHFFSYNIINLFIYKVIEHLTYILQNNIYNHLTFFIFYITYISQILKTYTMEYVGI